MSNGSKLQVTLPSLFSINTRLNKNVIQQLGQSEYTFEADVQPYAHRRAKGYILHHGDADEICIITNGARTPNEFTHVLHYKGLEIAASSPLSLSSASWLKHPRLQNVAAPSDYASQVNAVCDSWRRCFSYVEDSPAEQIKGLRPPQLGAVHAIEAHWSVRDEPATVVMPTGTGKTETMLSVLVARRCKRVLVIVPTDALRAQIAHKFLTLGMLKDLGVVADKALYPIVGTLLHKPRNVAEVDDFFEKCNVIVSTIAIAGQCSDEVQERMAYHCSDLFIDEAHHIAARTWRDFKHKFDGRRVVQFTATPFRNDNKPVDGRIIFNYPMRKAQEQDYFRPIRFKPIVEFDPKKVDQRIAELAVEQLREDRKQYDHILMARVADVERAEEVYKIYQQYPEFNPVQIHYGIKSVRERERIRQQIIRREAKIVVCVDMLGEGFDLPELKIAAFHDIRKSLAVTLQLAGRFTRAKPNLGNATFIANIADPQVREELKRLYMQDADWNILLQRSSEDVIQEQLELWEFLEGFSKFPEDIPLQNLRPALSTTMYRTACDEWTPENFKEGLPGLDSVERIYHDVNYQKNTLVIVTARKVPIDWSISQELYNWDWQLYIVFWDKEQQMLFINNSDNSGYYQSLAEAVAGSVTHLSGPYLFRCFAAINRLKLQNVGLSEELGRLIRYTMRAGSDIEAGLTQAHRRNTRKSNIFGTGYEGGARSSVGCSYKGRIWSHRTGNLATYTTWCSAIGAKVLDETIDADEVLKGTLVPVLISERPELMPITVDWPEEMIKEPETMYEIVFNEGPSVPMCDTDISLVEPAETGELRFRIHTEAHEIVCKLQLFPENDNPNYRFVIEGSTPALIRYRSQVMNLREFFYRNPPVFWFVDGSTLVGNSFTELKQVYSPYHRDRIQEWDWTGTDICNESQKVVKETDSIQYRVIQELERGNYDIIYDDDGSGEIADVVAIHTEDKAIVIELFHCKYSSSMSPGARIGDLYEVCGQAQKSIRWADPQKQSELLFHMLRREVKTHAGHSTSRYEKGDKDKLYVIYEMSRSLPVHLKVHIVQPGLSKSRASEQQLELLSVTENYLMETYRLPFSVIASS